MLGLSLFAGFGGKHHERGGLGTKARPSSLRWMSLGRMNHVLREVNTTLQVTVGRTEHTIKADELGGDSSPRDPQK